MNGERRTRTGAQLYELLPEVYRTRDGGPSGDLGDLAAYLDACGELLDRIRNTLDQLLADHFPDRSTAGRAAQDWILPYLAQLVDVRLVSPEVEGRRREVTRAVAWRQRKGTLRAVEEIAEAVGQMEVEVQEGWRRVATTPRVDTPLLPAAAFGSQSEPDRNNPLEAARHPGLPAVTIDLTRPARALRSEPGRPGARFSRFAGETISWRQGNPHGVPCFPGSFDDPSRRTVDLRTPSWRHGHAHPRRVLLYAPPPLGFFPDFQKTVTVRGERAELEGMAARRLVVSTEGVDQPVLVARDCLFEEVVVRRGLVRLEHTTVMRSIACRRLQASDCIFAGTVTLPRRAEDLAASCVRYSRIPGSLAARLPVSRRPATTTEPPVFFDFESCDPDGVLRRSMELGAPGHGVLHPSTPPSIRFGAEDGGEMGAYHHRRLSLQAAAILEKLEEFLPVGLEAVLVPDPRLLTPPPARTD